jgi:hypothetical protein
MFADSGRPICQIKTVSLEERQHESIHAESHASGMSLVAVLGRQRPRRAEMIAMTIETHARGRFLLGTQRYQQFKFQRLFQLAHRGQSAGSSEKRITGRNYLMGEAEKLRQLLGQEHPSSPKFLNLFGRPDANELAHAEGLEPSNLVCGLVTKTI